MVHTCVCICLCMYCDICVNVVQRIILCVPSDVLDTHHVHLATAYKWTDGKAVVATGSPFHPVTMQVSSGQTKTFIPSQCNNMYIFPGIGLACSVAGVTTITNKMLYLAAKACTDTMTAEEIAEGRTFPNIKRIREGMYIICFISYICRWRVLLLRCMSSTLSAHTYTPTHTHVGQCLKMLLWRLLRKLCAKDIPLNSSLRTMVL